MVAPGTMETDLIEAAASALKIGNVNEARRLLRGVIAKNPANLVAWKMAYQASSSDEERVYSLDAILKLTPGDAWARQTLAELQNPSFTKNISTQKSNPAALPKPQERKKRSPSIYLLGSFVGIAGLACVVLWILVFYQWGVFPFSLHADQTQTALASSHANCQALIDRALAASSNLCNKIGSDQACYGNNTVNARLVPGSAQQFKAPGDIVGVDQIESVSASVLDPALKQWGIAIFKVISNLPRSLPGETITLVVFGNTTLQNSGSLETYYFYSGLGQVACDQIPFDGLMITMPEGTGIHFVVNGSELTLMGNASLKADKNGSMQVNLYSGSGAIASAGQQQIFTAGESVSVPLGGLNGTDAIGPPTTPQPLSPDDLDVACSLTGTYCDPADITAVPSDLAVQWLLTANALTATWTPFPTFTNTPKPTGTSSATVTRTATRTSTPSVTFTPSFTRTATRTSTRTGTRTSTPTRTPTRTHTPLPTNTPLASSTPTPTDTPSTPTDTFTPSTPTDTFTPSTPTDTFTPSDTFVPTDTITPIPPTSTPTPGMVVVQIIVPAVDGAVISNNSQTRFEAKAWDTAVGTTNGNGIIRVKFWFSGPRDLGHPAGNPRVETSVRYCAFTGTGTCNTMGGGLFTSLPSGIYTMYVQATGVSGVSDVVTITFVK